MIFMYDVIILSLIVQCQSENKSLYAFYENKETKENLLINCIMIKCHAF